MGQGSSVLSHVTVDDSGSFGSIGDLPGCLSACSMSSGSWITWLGHGWKDRDWLGGQRFQRFRRGMALV